jgi:imidazolonepropionase-like amidohydrolase
VTNVLPCVTYSAQAVNKQQPNATLRISFARLVRRIDNFTYLFVAIWFFGCSKPAGPALAITHATLIDATGAPPQPDMTILIGDHRITAVGGFPSISIPRNAQVIDATGKFLIPALFDSHVHLTGAGEPEGSRNFFLPLLLANGIATVRDMGGYLESLVPLRRDIREGKRLGPEIFFAGPYLDGSPPSFQPSMAVVNAVEASEDVRTLTHQGVDFIKVQSILSRDAYFAIAAAARREHIAFVGHVPERVTAAEASEAGQKSIEHLTGVLRACSSDEPRLMREQFQAAPSNATAESSHAREMARERELLRTYSDKQAGTLIAKFVHNQTCQVPTLILLRNDAYPAAETDSPADPLLRFVPRAIAEKWKQVRLTQDRLMNEDDFDLREKLFAQSMRVVAQMQSSGVSILAGTDTAAPYVIPGFALHQELALLVKAGLSPMQALQAATKNPADFLGKGKTQGTIEPGKTADLLLLDANPLEDIRNTQKIRALIVRGNLLDRAALDGLLSSAQKFAIAN